MPAHALDTVADYIGDARVLLQDTIAPYRYDDSSLVTSFNLAIMEGRRIRPDLFIYAVDPTPPTFTVDDIVNATVFVMEEPFRQAFVYGTVSHAFARDQEDVQDRRANTFMTMFQSFLIGLRMGEIQGGTPGGQNQQPPGPGQ